MRLLLPRARTPTCTAASTRWPQEATELFEGARERIAAFVGGETATTIFTRNATEAINLVAYSWGREHVGEGDEVLITHMEHHSNIVPWQLLCQERGREAALPVGVRRGRSSSLDELDAVLAERPREARVASPTSRTCSARSTRSPRSPRRRAPPGAVSVIDGSQAVPQMPVDVRAIGADFYAWTGHKALGPDRASACCTAGASCWRRCGPFLGGGDMIAHVGFDTLDLERAAVEVRGRHLADRRGGGPRRRDRLPGGARHGRTCARTSATSPPTRSSAWPRSRACASSARPTPTAAAAWCPSSSRASTPTTSPSSATARASASAPATTAPSR